MKAPRLRQLRSTQLVLCAALFYTFFLTAGCDSGSEGDADGNMGGADSGDDAAILVGVFVRTPEGRNVYVGAEPEVPTGELDYSEYLEFSDVEASTHAGYVFIWEREAARMTRYAVTDDLELKKGPTLSFREEGAGNGSGFGSTVYISPTRAYTLSSALDRVIVWDPEAMELTGTIDMEPPERADGLSTSPSAGHVVGDSVIWPLRSTEWDGQNYFPGVAVAIADAHSDDEVRIVEDYRCVGSDGALVDDKGDFYIRAGGYWGTSAAYGKDADDVRTCVLRIKKGEDVFDSDYLIDMKELTGTYVNFPWVRVEGSKYLAHAWNPDKALPKSIDDYWDGGGLEPLLVDIETGQSEPFPDVADHTIVSAVQFELDGVSYYQLSKTGTAVEGSAEVVELHSDGVRKKFSLPELWALDRIR